MNPRDQKAPFSHRRVDGMDLEMWRSYIGVFLNMKMKCAEVFITKSNQDVVMLVNGIHPQLIEEVKRLEIWLNNELGEIEHKRNLELASINQEFEIEKNLIESDRKKYLTDYQAKIQKTTEKIRSNKYDRLSQKNTSRKLRRRPYEALLTDRKRNDSLSQGDEAENTGQIDEDVYKVINSLRIKRGINNNNNDNIKSQNSVYVSNGRLHVYKKFFEKGQSVVLESASNFIKIDGRITLISENEVVIRSTKDHSTFYVTLEDLRSKTHSIKRKS